MRILFVEADKFTIIPIQSIYIRGINESDNHIFVNSSNPELTQPICLAKCANNKIAKSYLKILRELLKKHSLLEVTYAVLDKNTVDKDIIDSVFVKGV